MSSQSAVNQDLEQKQTYLRKNIIDQGYDAQQFVNHCIGKYGDVDLGSWSMETLKRIVKEFVSQIQETNKITNQQEKAIQVNAISSHVQQENEEWDYADVPIKSKLQQKSPKKDENDEQWDDYIDGSTKMQNQKHRTGQQNKLINQNAKIIFNDADWEIFGIADNSKNKTTPKKMKSDKVIESKNLTSKQKVKTATSKQQSIFPQKLSLPNSISIKQDQIQVKRVKSIGSIPFQKPNPPVKKNKKEKSPQIPYQKYQHKKTKIKVRQNIISKELPNFSDIVVLKTQQISKGFLQSDFTLYHFVFKPINHVIKRKFSDLRRLRSILNKMYPTFRLPYLQPQGWINNSSQGKDPQMLIKYSYMAVQFLKYITITNQQLKQTQIVKQFLGLGLKKAEKQKQFAKKVLDDFNRLPKPKAIHDLTFKNPELILQPNPNFTKYIANHQNIITQVDLVYDKLKKQLQTLYYFYDQVSKALSDISGTFEQLEGNIAKLNFENDTKDEIRVYDGIKDMFIKLQNNINDRHKLIKNRIGALFKYEKDNMWTIRQIIDQRNKIHAQYIRNGSPQHPVIKYPQDIYTVTAILPLQEIVRGDKNCISIQNNFWQQMCAKQIQGYWKTLRRKINENLSLISYDELDMENENLNFWNSMIKKCIL